MDAVTYPDSKVAAFVSENIIPLRVAYNAEPLATDFNVKWTPNLIILDPDGKEHHRAVGFLGPDQFIPFLILGMARLYFDHGQFAQALTKLEKLLADYPESDSAPEAIYLQGICHYKSSHDAKPLKEAYERLAVQYPASEWAKRAYPYRLL